MTFFDYQTKVALPQYTAYRPISARPGDKIDLLDHSGRYIASGVYRGTEMLYGKERHLVETGDWQHIPPARAYDEYGVVGRGGQTS